MKVADALLQLEKIKDNTSPAIKLLNKKLLATADQQRQLTNQEEVELFVAQFGVIKDSAQREDFENFIILEILRISEYKHHDVLIKQILTAEILSEIPLRVFPILRKLMKPEDFNQILADGFRDDQTQLKVIHDHLSADEKQQNRDKRIAAQDEEKLIDKILDEEEVVALAKEVKKTDLQLSRLSSAYSIPIRNVLKELKTSSVDLSSDPSPFITFWNACKLEAAKNPNAAAKIMVIFRSLMNEMEKPDLRAAVKIIMSAIYYASQNNIFTSDNFLNALLPLSFSSKADQENLLELLKDPRVRNAPSEQHFQKIIKLLNHNQSNMMDKLPAEYQRFKKVMKANARDQLSLTVLKNAMSQMTVAEALEYIAPFDTSIDSPADEKRSVVSGTPASILAERVKKFRELFTNSPMDSVLKPAELAECILLKVKIFQQYGHSKTQPPGFYDAYSIISPMLSRIQWVYQNNLLNEKTVSEIYTEIIARFASDSSLVGVLPQIFKQGVIIHFGPVANHADIFYAMAENGSSLEVVDELIRLFRETERPANPFFIFSPQQRPESAYYVMAQHGNVGVLRHLYDMEMRERGPLAEQVEYTAVMLMGLAKVGMSDPELEKKFFEKYEEFYEDCLNSYQEPVYNWPQDLKLFVLNLLIQNKVNNEWILSLRNEFDELLNNEMHKPEFDKKIFLVLDKVYSPQELINKSAKLLERYLARENVGNPINIDILLGYVYGKAVGSKGLDFSGIERLLTKYFQATFEGRERIGKTAAPADAAVKAIYSYYKYNEDFDIHSVAGEAVEGVFEPGVGHPHYDRLLSFSTLRMGDVDAMQAREKDLPIKISEAVTSLQILLKEFSPSIKKIVSAKTDAKPTDSSAPSLANFWFACKKEAMSSRAGQEAMVLFRCISNALEMKDVKTAVRLSMAAGSILVDNRWSIDLKNDQQEDAVEKLNGAFFRPLGIYDLVAGLDQYSRQYDLEVAFRSHQPRILDLLPKQYADFKSFLKENPAEQKIFDELVKKIPLPKAVLLDSKDKETVAQMQQTKAQALASLSTKAKEKDSSTTQAGLFTRRSAPAGQRIVHARNKPENKGGGR